MKKFSQLNEGKIEIETNSLNYLSSADLKKYVDKMQSEFYTNVTISNDNNPDNKKTLNTKNATLYIINYLIKHNDTYIKDLAGNNKGNALAIFFRQTAPSDPEKLELYKSIAILHNAMRLKEVPTFMTSDEFNMVMSGKCSLDYVVYDMKTERGRNALAKIFKGLIYHIANQYKNHANNAWEEWLGEAHIGFTSAMNQYVEYKGIITKKNKNVEFDADTVKFDNELKREVKNNTKTADKYPVKFVVFAKWWINYRMLVAAENSHLVRIAKSEQKRERKENGKNTWDNTTSIDKKFGNTEVDDTVASITNDVNHQHSIGDNIESDNKADNLLTKKDNDKLFSILYKTIKAHFDKMSAVIFLTHFGLHNLEKIGNKVWFEYINI